MNTDEIKLKLDVIEKINDINEFRIIQSIKNLLDFELDDRVYQLNTEQNERLELARKEFSNEEIFTNEGVNIEIEQWLNEK